MTNGEFVARVVNGLKALNKDEHISRRYILRIGQNKSKFYISQKLLEKSLHNEANLYRTIPCLKLKRENTLQCGIHEFMRCEDLMKSKNKIPGIIYSKLGPSITMVTSMNGDTVYLPITLKSYPISRLRQNVGKLGIKYYYIKDDYIYLPDSRVEYVNITYIPYDLSELDELSECEEGGETTCKSVWEHQFVAPDKLSEQIITETIQEVAVTKGFPTDENPNGDSNEKSRTQ